MAEDPNLNDSSCVPIQHLTINGQERYEQINGEDFIVDFKNFIDKKSNKIRFKLDAVLKMLPYNGFYPQQRTMQIAAIFNKIYLDNSRISDDTKRYDNCITQDETQSVGTSAAFATLAATQPLFSPGILFNTIKAGIAMPWSCYVGSNTNFNILEESIQGIENHKAYYTNVNNKLAFETILDPAAVYYNLLGGRSLSSAYTRIYYLDPTHHGFLENYEGIQVPGYATPYLSKNNVINMRFVSKQNMYKSAINNFLYETANFFLKDGKLTNFKSKTFLKDEELFIEPRKEYVMDIVIRKNLNFSMFNDKYYLNKTEYGLSEVTEGDTPSKYIPVASLFGPPTQANDHDSEEAYYHFCPPYFRKNSNNEERITLKLLWSPDFGGLTDPNLVYTKTIHLKDVFDMVSEEFDRYILNQNEEIINLGDCIKLSLKTEQDGSYVWYIQTKFETPLINFNKCYFTFTQIRADKPIKDIEVPNPNY